MSVGKRNAERPAEPEIARLRGEVDALDDALLELLTRRADVARRLGDLKRTARRALRDPPRETEVLAHVCARAEAAGLPPERVAAVWRALMRLCLAVQRR